jgi:zeaxanthin glucosyltransferase
MATITLLIHPATSHLNATFKMAKSLQNRGHEIIYLDITDGFVKKAVQKQGFRSVQIGLIEYPNVEHHNPKRSVWNKIKKHFDTLKTIDTWIVRQNIYQDIMKQINPDLLILDFHFAPDVVMLEKFNVPIVFYNLYVPLTKAPYVPVCTSDLIPKKNIISWLSSEWSWVCHRVLKYIENNIYNKYISTQFEERLRINSIQKKLSKINQFPYADLVNNDRAFQKGFKHIPELVSSPPEFDFVREQHPNQVNISPAVDLDRIEVMPNDIIHYRDCTKKGLGQALVYVSLGTLSDTQFGDSSEFFKKIIDAFGHNYAYKLLLSVGENVDIASFGACPPNVFIFQRVPQIDALKYADVMITHGGISSITECILSEVPMLVLPLSNKFDQPGNAARVVYHKIGLRGNLRTESITSIKQKVDKLLDKVRYKIQIRKMKKKIYQNDSFNQGIEFIENMIASNHKISKLEMAEMMA